MKKVLFLLYAAAIIGILIPGCNGSQSGSGDAVDLKLNLQKGKTYTYLMKSDMNIAMDLMGKPMNTTANIDFGFKMKVEDIDAQHNFNMTASYNAIRFKMSAMGMDLGYDSGNLGDTTKENTMNNMFRKVFSSMVGRSFKLTMSPKGEVLKVDSLKELVQSMADNIDVPDNMKAQMRKQMTESFNEDQVKQGFAQGFSIYPEKPVKVGDSWTKNVDKTMNSMKMKQEIKYTVKEIKDNNVLLDMTGIITSAMASDSTSAVKLDMSGDEKGSMELLRSTGLVSKANIDMTMKMTAAGHPMNMKVKVTLEGKE